MSTLKTTNITHGSNSGTENLVLASNGNVTIGGALSAAGGRGKVLQYVYESAGTQITTSGAGISELIDATITPASASNKILVIANAVLSITNHNSNAYAMTYLYRGASEGTELHQENIGTTANHAHSISTSPWILDSPNTTSAQEYTFSMSRGSSGTSHVATSAHCNYHLMLIELEG